MYYQAYGNFQLLESPFKEQVLIHRADTPDKRGFDRDRWLYTGTNGDVLVSPFISQPEKAVRAEAEDAGARFILITNRPFTERYKPSGRDFELCEAARMLIVSISCTDTSLSRSTCLAMNTLAATLCRQ